MSGWGSPEQEAERARLQQEQLRRQEDANRQRLADIEAKRRAEEARQKEQREKTTAMMEGAAGKRSHRSFTHSGDYMLGAALCGRDPVTGKSNYEATAQSGRSSSGAAGVVPARVPVKRRLEQIWDTSVFIVIGLLIYGFANSVGIVDYVKAQLSFQMSPASSPSETRTSSHFGGVPLCHYITADRLNIRTGPGVNYSSLGTQPGGGCIAVLAQVNAEWSQVMVPTASGPQAHFAASAFLAPLTSTDLCR